MVVGEVVVVEVEGSRRVVVVVEDVVVVVVELVVDVVGTLAEPELPRIGMVRVIGGAPVANWRSNITEEEVVGGTVKTKFLGVEQIIDLGNP